MLIRHAAGRRERFRIGVVDLMATTARGMAGAQFSRLIAAALARHRTGADLFVVNLDPTDRWPGIVGTRDDWAAIASFDAVVVTGAEPRTAELRLDPSFALIEKILTVTTARAAPVVFSCLSAHAALQHLGSVPRRRLATKRVGMFQHQAAADAGPLAAGLPDSVAMPHSRWHTVDRDALAAADVSPLLLTDDGDWAAAVGADGLSHLFLQAHPEYFADTLFREYRRDVRRYLDRSSDHYPAVPAGYLPPDTVGALADFSFQALRCRSPKTLHALPDVRFAGPGGWSSPAAVLVANWLSGVFGVVNA